MSNTHRTAVRRFSADDVFDAVEAHGSTVAMALLWLLPALLFLAGLLRF
jgi:hypothetical protein